MKKTFKYCACVAFISLTLCGCGNPKLKDGTELLFEMDGIKYTVDDFYQKLKDSYGTYALVGSIDEKLLDKTYETTDDMKTKVESNIKTLKMIYGSDFDDTIYRQYGASTEKQLYNLLLTSIKEEEVTKDYVKAELLKDDEVKKYYDEELFGDIRASHILIKSTASSTATDEDKEKAEKEALEKAKELIKKLDEGADFAELAKENSDDTSASDGGDVGYFNVGDMVEEFENASRKLKVGEYSKEPVKTQYGYHIILKTDEKEKEKFEDVKEEITDKLVEELIDNTDNISAYALEWLRENNGLKIYDPELKIKYDHYMNQQKSVDNVIEESE